jgi:predicted kinase
VVPPELSDRTITDMSIGSDQTLLIVLRGNSGSGKSTVAKALREAYGRGIAWVSQDLIRRTILREKDQPGGINIGLIDRVTRYSLEPAPSRRPPR